MSLVVPTVVQRYGSSSKTALAGTTKALIAVREIVGVSVQKKRTF